MVSAATLMVGEPQRGPKEKEEDGSWGDVCDTEGKEATAIDEAVVAAPAASAVRVYQMALLPDNTTSADVDGEHHASSLSGLSFSDSSNNDESCPADFASLLGEAIESKETTSTTRTDALENPTDDDDAVLRPELLPEDPPLPSLLPKYRSWSPEIDSSDTILDLRDDIKKSAPVLPPKEDASTVRSASSSSTGALLENFVGRVMGHHSALMDRVACPCCQQCFEDPTHVTQSTLIEPHGTPQPRSSNISSSIGSSSKLLPCRGLSLISVAESEDMDEEQLQLEVDLKTGVLGEGVSYRISRVLVEGILHKKGTGHDWLKSRGWKPRWARLAVGRIDGYGDIAVPILCISWYPTSTVNSTVIVLDSTVVLAVDLPNKEKAHRFEIRHASSRENSSLPVTRTFTADSRKARDAWVYAISQALLSYEKEKALARKQSSKNCGPSLSRQPTDDRPYSPPRSFDAAWMGDRFTTVDQPRSPVTPTTTSCCHHRTLSVPPPPSPRRHNMASPPRSVRSPTITSGKGTGQRHAPRIATRSTTM